MFLASLRIKNYRCFADQTIEFCPGVNVLTGENNAGKTTVLSALGLVFDPQHRHRLTYFDFHQPSTNRTLPPSIDITAVFRSTKGDTIYDKALVAKWLTKLEPPWEATLTYTFNLDPEDDSACRVELKAISNDVEASYRRIVERFLPKYVTHVFAGDPTSVLAADREMLDKIDFRMLDALRDAERLLFSGTDPLLKYILLQVRDKGKEQIERDKSDAEFDALSAQLGKHLHSRHSLDPLLSFVTETGALEGGKPTLKDNIALDDILSVLHLYVEGTGISVPAERNGMGYNNLIYISLVLASIDNEADSAKSGPNAKTFPILCIEEPEAHLHPSLQYKLLKYLQTRVSPSERTKQVFITTHSTHIASASELDQIICLTLPLQGEQHVAYPGRCFPTTPEGEASKAYVQRYLDATKSNLLFAKGILLVEGIAELLLVPVLADQIDCSFATHHVAIISVGGITFKHFLPLFGAELTPDQAKYALKRPVACLIDGDCKRKEKKGGSKFIRCLPYQLGRNQTYEDRPTSESVTKLEAMSTGCNHLIVRHTTNTLEYDLAYCNHSNPILVTAACTNAKALKELMTKPTEFPESLGDSLNEEEANDLAAITDINQRERHRVATCYLRSVEDSKGEHAFALAQQLRANFKPGITIPRPIEDVIRHATGRHKI
jgi:putative ATP-dependent endonuclease of the OLD family